MATKNRTALIHDPVHADDVVVRTTRLADALAANVGPLFAEYGLTMPQFNILRILYVQDPELEGLPTGSIRERLLVRGPDVTRLIDRIEKAGLVERVRSAEDRRVVNVRLTEAGTDLVEEIHEPLMQHNRELFATIPESDLEQLAELLSRALKALE